LIFEKPLDAFFSADWRRLLSKYKSLGRNHGNESVDTEKSTTQRQPRNFRLNSSMIGFRSSQKLSENGIVVSEIDLHSIKTSFQAIECLWRDLSLGMDFISKPMLLGIHDNLGEIGSDLFGKLFLNGPDSKQVRAF
jgi:hypothetical protein